MARILPALAVAFCTSLNFCTDSEAQEVAQPPQTQPPAQAQPPEPQAQTQPGAKTPQTLPPVVVTKAPTAARPKQRQAVKTKKEPAPPPPVASSPASFETETVGPAGPSDEGVSYSANRTPTDMSKVGSTVEIVTGKQIEAQSRPFVRDYLDELPGVTTAQSGPAGSQATLSIRGADQKYVKVLIDGIDVSDPSVTQTAPAIEHLMTGDVGRMEVVKGSQSTLYGGEAVGGVITITSKDAPLGPSMGGMIEGGSYDTGRGFATAAYGAPEGYARFSVQGILTEGFSAADERYGNTEKDGYSNVTFSGSGEYALSNAVKLFFAGRAIDANVKFDDGATPAGYPGDSNARVVSQTDAGRAGAEVKLFDGAFVNTFAIQGFEVDRNYTGGVYYSAAPAFYNGDRIKGEYLGTLTANDWLTFVAGADYERDGADSTYTDGRRTVDLAAGFGQVQVQPFKGLTLTAGGRDDENSAFGNFPTYRVTSAYFIDSTETKFRASNGTGFRAPSLYELYAPYYGNSNLQPETSFSWDAGVDQFFYKGRYRLSATYFELDTTDEISFGVDAAHPLGGYIQIPGTTHRTGVELSANIPVNPWLSFYASYTYTDARTDAGVRLWRIPYNTFAFNVNTLFFDCVKATVTTRVALDTVDVFFNQVTYASRTVPLENYVLLNAKLSYDITPTVTAYVRGENLLDQKYETVFGYGTPGISGYAGLTFKVGG